MEEKKKNTVLLTVVAIATLVVAVIGATFAYFQAQGGNTVTRNVRIVTETADSTSYSIDKALTLNINQQNFYEGAGDKSSDPVTGIALFTASTGAGNDLCYTLAINVTSNNFIYTTDTSAQPTTKYRLTISGLQNAYYDDIDTNQATETALLTALTPGGYVTEESGTYYIKPTPTSTATPVEWTTFKSTSARDALLEAGYLETVSVYPTSSAPELVLTVTRATVANANDPENLTYGSPTTVINNLDVTTLTGTIYVPDTATATTVVTPSNKGDLGTVLYFDETGGPQNIHKLTAAAGKTTSHKYIATLTAKNKAYDQQEITDKTFTGTLTFTTVTCDAPAQNP